MDEVVNILAIETATSACAMAVRTTLGAEFELRVDDERHHTEALTPGIRDLLEQTGLSAKDLDRVVVDRGPGLFTGLRVGIATAIGLSVGAHAELVGVTSLELLAHGAHDLGVRGALVSCVDGRRGEVFVQSFDLDVGVLALSEPHVTTPEELFKEWAEREVTITGDGAARYRADLLRADAVSIFDQLVPPPLEALRLGALRSPEATVQPLYLRDADAVANFATRDGTS